MEKQSSRKRQRTATGPRTRTGCISCKQKHIKCDETKPVCGYCCRMDTTCSYPDPTTLQGRRKRDPSQIVFRKSWMPTTPESLASPGSTVSTVSTFTFCPTPQPRRAFTDMGYRVLEYFHQQTVPMIAHFFPSDFWTKSLPQMSESVPAIKHCVLALGSWHLHIDTSNTPAALQTSSRSSCELLFSADNYSKAISALANDTLANTLNSSALEGILLACVLFAIYESLRGAHTQLTMHVRQGLNLARQQSLAGNLTGIAEFATKQLALLRLAQEMRAPISDSLSSSLEDSLFDVPTRISELDQDDNDDFIEKIAAEVQNVGNDVYRFARKCNAGVYHENQPLRDFERQHLQTRCAQVREKLAQPVLMFMADTAGVKILKSRLELSWIMLRLCWTLYQTPFDSYVAHFAKIVKLAGEVLRQQSLGGRPPAFSVNLGLIPLLFYVARLCRHPELRRKAVDLLDMCPRIEGLWHAREAAAVARFVIALEETKEEIDDVGSFVGQLDEGYHDWTMIPEQRRIHSVRFRQADSGEVLLDEDTLHVTIMLRPEAAVVRLEERAYRISCAEWASGRGELRNVLQTLQFDPRPVGKAVPRPLKSTPG